jgi:hypothetical protein
MFGYLKKKRFLLWRGSKVPVPALQIGIHNSVKYFFLGLTIFFYTVQCGEKLDLKILFVQSGGGCGLYPPIHCSVGDSDPEF